MMLRNNRAGRVVILSACLVVGLFSAAPLAASAIYNNFGSGNSFIINRDYQTNFDYLATPFVATGGGNLGTILTPIFSLNSPVSFGLYTDSSGEPGTLLENWSSPVPGFPAQIVTLTSALNPMLSAGTQYWFVIALTSSQKNELAWYQNNQAVNGGVWAGFQLNAMFDFVPGSPIPAIQLNSASSSVPEPASGMLIGGGLFLLRFVRAKKSRKPWQGTLAE